MRARHRAVRKNVLGASTNVGFTNPLSDVVLIRLDCRTETESTQDEGGRHMASCHASLPFQGTQGNGYV
jgi:hypothetical protein